MEICDQGVVIGGGWSRELSPQNNLRDINNIYTMMRHNGFHKRNIKIFFANGIKKNTSKCRIYQLVQLI